MTKKFKSLLDIPIGTKMICDVDHNRVKAGDMVTRIEGVFDRFESCSFINDDGRFVYLSLSQLSDLPEESDNLHFTRIYDLSLLVKNDVVNIFDYKGRLGTYIVFQNTSETCVFFPDDTGAVFIFLDSFKNLSGWAKQVYLVTLKKPTRKGL